MIREYHNTDWKEICRVFDVSKPCELATGGVSSSFLPLAQDTARIADFEKCVVFVWEEAGRVRAFVGYRGCCIGWLFVEPSAFRQGIGRALLRHALARIEGPAWLWSMKGNHATISLYESEGFVITEERLTHNGPMPCVAVKLESKKPNKAPEPTPTAVTPRAIEMKIEGKDWIADSNEARVVPAAVVAHL